MSERDGGAAFPFEYLTGGGDYGPVERNVHPGMSLRDYFAAQAMGPLAGLWGGRIGDVDAAALNRTAVLAYAFADVMLVVRKQR